MWDFLLGELGLAPAVARGLDWVEVDHYLHGYEARRQKELAGHRMVATRIHNLFPGDTGPLTEAQFHHLPLVDGPKRPAVTVELKEMRDRLAAENAKKLAEKAATQAPA